MPWKKLRTSQGRRDRSRVPGLARLPTLRAVWRSAGTSKGPQSITNEEQVRAIEQRDQLTEVILFKLKTNPDLVSDETTRNQLQQLLSLDAQLSQPTSARAASGRPRRPFARVVSLIVLGVAIVAGIAIASFPGMVDGHW